MLKSAHILACLFAFGLALAPSYAAEHANNPEENSDSDSTDADGKPLEQPEKEKTEAEKRKEEVDKIVKKHTEVLEKAEKDEMSDEQKKNLEAALDALMDPNGSLAELSPEALEQALKLLQDKLAGAEGEEEKSKIQSAIDRGTQQIEKIAEAKKNLEVFKKLAEGYVKPALNVLGKLSSNPEKAVGDAARSLGESIAKQSNAQAAAAKSKDSSGWAGTLGAATGAIMGGSMFGSAGAVIGGMLGYSAGSYVDNQAQQAGGYSNYAGNVLGGTNYTNPSGGGNANPSFSMSASAPVFAPSNPVETTPSILAGATTAGQFALNSGPAASSRTAQATSTAGFSDTVRSDLDAALSQATRGPGFSRPAEYGPSSGASATTPTTSTAVEEPSFEERVAEVMAGMPGNQVENAGEGTQEAQTVQGKLAGTAATSAVMPTVVPAANAVVASGATQAAAAQAATQASIDAAKLPEAIARRTTSEPAKVDEDSKAAPVIARTDGIYADFKKAPGEKNPVPLETASYSAPANPGGTTAVETDSPSETKVTSSVPESTVETALAYTRNAVESLMRTDIGRGVAATTETASMPTAAPLPGKLTIAGLTNPRVSEATVKAFQAALPTSLAGTIPVGASKMDGLWGLLRNNNREIAHNNREIAQRGISSIKPKTLPTSPAEPSPNAIVKDGPKGDVFSRFFAGQI